MLPYEVKFKYNAFKAETEILVNNRHYDVIEDFVSEDEKPHLTYTILKRLYADDAQKELSALRRENQQLKSIVSVYNQMENIESKFGSSNEKTLDF